MECGDSSPLLLMRGKAPDKSAHSKLKFEPERLKFEPDRSNFKPERLKFEPERSKFEPERSKFKPERLKFKPERLKFKPDRLKFKPERLKFKPERLKFEPERLKFKPDRPNLQLSSGKVQTLLLMHGRSVQVEGLCVGAAEPVNVTVLIRSEFRERSAFAEQICKPPPAAVKIPPPDASCPAGLAQKPCASLPSLLQSEPKRFAFSLVNSFTD